MPRLNWKILQLITSTERVYAIYKNGEDDGSDLKVPVTLWALVEDENGERLVAGIDVSDYPDFCEGASNFDRYVLERET